ncbi:MAG: crossover junction endodeoxyribonuclease RuvC [Deltaproteobacteria bacterium]|nr:crossover junction endodeoxyribonuclease RuvC [Deltaproteobacteria bacterium]
MRIIGVDPGSTATGYGVVDYADGRVVHVAHGILRPPRTASLAARLAHIHGGLAEIVALHAPDTAVVEKVFVASNPRSALVLGQARGVALAALAAAGLTVGELAAREVKKAVVGHGGAAKAQVQTMVMRLLDLRTEPASDAADALAVAICQAHAGRLAGLDVRGRRRRSVRARHEGEWTRMRT